MKSLLKLSSNEPEIIKHLSININYRNDSHYLAVSLLCLMTLSASAAFEYSHEFAVESAYYAKAVRCSKEPLEAWNCGESCDFHPNMKDVKVHELEHKPAQVMMQTKT
jgi:hypothetical protein